jgi:hypothetical protein
MVSVSTVVQGPPNEHETVSARLPAYPGGYVGEKAFPLIRFGTNSISQRPVHNTVQSS